MAAKDRYTVHVTCKQCNSEGEVRMSENDYPFMNALDRTVDGIDGRFTASNKDGDVTVTCMDCGATVY